MVRGDLILVDLGHGKGTEPGKIRPAVIIQSDILTQAAHESTIVLVCTSQLVGETLLRVCLPAKAAGNKLETEVLVDQIRAVDNRRILRKLGKVPEAIFEEVEEKLRLVLSLDQFR
jgi:mRNA interferase MazF